MKKYIVKSLTFALVLVVGACSEMYRDEILPPTDQELSASKTIAPRGILNTGVFHMQKVQDGSTVRVRDYIQLKRPDLPPFDVAYISRDLESVLLEIANAAGESIVIPQGMRNRTITLIHSGADFEQMLDLVLRKAGYHYNYVDGIWYVTRYPIRNYVLETGQSSREGTLKSEEELERETSSTDTTASSGTSLETKYSDEVWSQVESTIAQLVDVGKTDMQSTPTASSGASAGSGQLLPESDSILAPPGMGGEGFEFGSITEEGGFTPEIMTAPESTDHLVEEENVSPWYRVTKGAALITVRAAPEAHRLIENYLEQVQQSLNRQVYVEARIVAVIRDKTTDRGADWSVATDAGNSVIGTLGFRASTPVTDADRTGIFGSFVSPKDDLTAVLQNLSTIADVYTISSPSTLVRNNQLSRVSITRQLGYAETEVEQSTTSGGDVVIGSRTDSAEFKNAGTVMSVLPFIGRSRVQMRFRLSVASQSGDTAIQTSVGEEETITNLVPELSNNVIDQDMVLEFGRVYAIGGLIETSTGVDGTYAPLLNLLPGMSEVFQRATNRKQDTEFVVLLKVSRA
jgi:type II secretory pathway component GspD/PulD (secretin)